MATPNAIPEDLYVAAPRNVLLREWLSMDLSKQVAMASVANQPIGTYVVRRSQSKPGSYAVTVREAERCKSYEVRNLGLGQVIPVSTRGMAHASLEHMLEFYYDVVFPDDNPGHVRLTSMCPVLVNHGQSQSSNQKPPALPNRNGTLPRAGGGAPPPLPNRNGTLPPRAALPLPNGNGVPPLPNRNGFPALPGGYAPIADDSDCTYAFDIGEGNYSGLNENDAEGERQYVYNEDDPVYQLEP